jgi:hypothetical protein
MGQVGHNLETSIGSATHVESKAVQKENSPSERELPLATRPEYTMADRPTRRRRPVREEGWTPPALGREDASVGQTRDDDEALPSSEEGKTGREEKSG